ncbi:MAG TPA: di-heme oxidoredictase family protein [Solirubrobacterales bacterium]|nr:di-heme oxidoredictase family protein [Solirubrobacterales bacterium]
MRRAALCSAVAALCLPACHRAIRPGDPLRGLTSEQRKHFARGKDVFKRTFTPATGLGPLFNSTSCGECHESPKAGGRGDEVEVHAAAFRDGVCDPLVQEGGFVIQEHTTPKLKQALGIDEEPFPPSATGRGMRTTTAIFARGLLDLVPEEDVLAYADPDDRNHDGISGRPNRWVDGRLGRFGRKAFIPTLAEFNAGAFVAEIGITNPAQPTEESIGGKPIPPGVDPVPEPEIKQAELDLTDDFVRFLARPTPAKLDRKGRRGRDLFSDIGCAACHVPTLRTGRSPVHALDRKEFPAYTDLLLHDMGPDLADICLGLATPSEFRTEPLIDLRHAENFLHDGRASTLEQAIEAHGGEGSAARDRFKALGAAERKALVAFLESL